VRGRIQDILVVVLVAFAVFGQYQLGEARAEAEANRVRADSIAAEKVASEIAADSVWEIRFAEQSNDLQSRLAAKDDTLGALASRLDSANVRIGLLSEVTASAQGQIVSLSNRNGALADSLAKLDISGDIGGDIEDEILTGTWLVTLPQLTHTLDYSVAIPGEIVVSRTGDGRTLVTARSTTPRAELRLGQVFVDPPPPEVHYRLSYKQAGVFLGIGAVVWELLR
jgi:hypothetical protein